MYLPDFKKILSQDNKLMKVAEAVDALGLETYIIGGWVRDRILKRPDRKDIDIVVIGSGIELFYS
jgi:tRNA nucleotidyltransferase/poly(A) polymerase